MLTIDNTIPKHCGARIFSQAKKYAPGVAPGLFWDPFFPKRDDECWHKLFTDIMNRFTRVKEQLVGRTTLSPEAKNILSHADEYYDFLVKGLQSGRAELYPVLQERGISILKTMSSVFRDNVFIVGAGPVGLIMTYFLKMSMPFLKIVVYDNRPEYTRDYHVMLTEDSFDSLPHEMQSAIWGAGRLGCYILPPPIDANGYCFLNPPDIGTEIPGHLYSGWYPDDTFDVNSRTGKRSLKKLMSVPIKVFENNLYSLIQRQFPDVTFIKPRSHKFEDQIIQRRDPDSTWSGEFWTNDGKLIAKDVFSTDFINNFYIDASGANPKSSFMDKSDLSMTVIISHDSRAMGTIKESFNEKTIDFRPAQNNARLFTPNQGYPNLLLSVRNLPVAQPFLPGPVNWTVLHPETQEHIKKLYQMYFDKELDPAKITRITMFKVYLGQANSMYTTSGPGEHKFLLGDSACAVHFFSGTGINNGIKMATKLTETLCKVYQSRWKHDLVPMFKRWEEDMQKMCTETLKKSRQFIN